jgi:DNA-binding transcriptional LysR family regulator
MTLDQLRIFVAVAEREHLTDGAKAVNLTPSAATAAIQALEGRYKTKLFHRVGRRLELSENGRAFLAPARSVIAAATAAEVALVELNDLSKGKITLAASQTLASHWLPSLLVRFADAHQGIGMELTEGNTSSVAAAVLSGDAEIGCIEGVIDEPALATEQLATDRLVIVAAPGHPLATQKKVRVADLERYRWIMREPGSGTRAVFENAMREASLKPEKLLVALSLPTNEGVCGAVIGSKHLTVVSELAALPYLQAGRLQRVNYMLPTRRFAIVRHKERFRSRASLALVALMREEAREMVKRQRMPDYEI